MANPSPSWDTVPVYHRGYRSLDGTPKVGQIKFTVMDRITVTDDGITFPGPGSLTVALDSEGAFTVDFPAIDDPDISPADWSVKVEEKFSDGSGKVYYIQPTLAMRPNGLDLSTVVVPASAPSAPAPALLKGVPGGLAALNDAGKVIDADGNVVEGGTDVDLSGYVTTADLTAAIPTTAAEVGADPAGTAAAAVNALKGAVPAAFDTLKEISDALAEDDSVVAALTTTVAGKYTKPGTGIPSTDLAAAVQTSLGKADAAAPATDVTALAADVAGKYTLPEGGIPATDLAIPGRTWDVQGQLVRSGIVVREGLAWHVGDPDPTAGGTIPLPEGVHWTAYLTAGDTQPSWLPDGSSLSTVPLAPAIRAYGVTKGTPGAADANASWTLPAGIKGGDAIRLPLSLAGAATAPAAPPAGYAVEQAYLSSGASDTNGVVVYKKIAAGTKGQPSPDAGATVAVTLGGTAQWVTGSFVTKGDPAVDALVTGVYETNSVTMPIPGFTPSAVGGLAVVVSGIRYSINTNGGMVTPPAAWTERVDGNSSTKTRGLWLADMVPAGAVASANATLSDSGRASMVVYSFPGVS